MTQGSDRQAVPEITCREVAEWTSAYIDAHMDEELKVRIALHLASCAGCEAYVKQIASVRNLLGLLPNAPETPTDPERLRQAFSARYRTP